jgi:acyl dehydratase
MRTEFVVTLPESVEFARLSGDFNPLHIDPIHARRTPFGSTVVHGMHLLLKSLDSVAALLGGAAPVECSVTFSNPVVTGAAISLETQFDATTRKLRLTGTTAQRGAFVATFLLGDSAPRAAVALDAVDHPAAAPRASKFPPEPDAGRVALTLHPGLLRRLLPQLAELPEQHWIADLLASTRIVGMECPGMNSIYSGCKLRRTDTPGARRALEYHVAKVDERFKLIRLQVQGGYFSGTLETFFRPPPVEQPLLAEVCRHVTEGAYRGHHALVVGGSRGLGELAAKAVLAGGGAVTLTYARGKEDALRICREAQALARTCSAEELDVDQLLQAPPSWLTGAFTHVYYFASPHIGKTAGTHWDAALFGRFARVYVDAFAALVQSTATRPAGQPPVRYLYPSSVYAAQVEKGFAEYASAKAAGELLCDSLVQSLGVSIARPRLPRMRTDQTSGLMDTGAVDALPSVLDFVRQLHS